MGTSREEPVHSALLRQRAELALRGKPVELGDLSSEDVQYLLHELQVHQTELGIQNEDLRQTQIELETSRDQYSDLYNFAPAGYCTIDRKAHILKANQTLANLLGIDHEQLLKERFARFVIPEDRDALYLYSQQAFKGQCCHSIEIRLVRTDGEMMYVHLESMLSHADAENLMVMVIDITQQREFQHRLVDQREKERQKIARDLHDGPVQALASINFTLQGMLSDYPDDRLAKDLTALQERIREQIRVLRNYAVDLRPPMLAHLGLEKAIQSHAESFREEHPELGLRLEIPPGRMALSEQAGVVLFRIYQEALMNVVKHALPGVREVTVRLEKNEHLARLEIQDNGAGFDLPNDWLDFAQEGHLGILGMRERAEAVGGQIKIQSIKGSGTQIEVMVPLNL